MFSGPAGKALVIAVLCLAGLVTPALATQSDAPTPQVEGGETPTPTPTPAPTASANGTASNNSGGGGILGGLGGFASWFGGIANALANPLETFQDYAERILSLLIDRPVPTRNGEPAWFQQPDGDIMGAVWTITWTMALPVSVLLTALYGGVTAGLRGLFPPSVLPKHAANSALWEAAGKIFHVLFGWTIMAGWAILTQAISKWAAPEGQEIFANGQAVNEAVVAGGIGGLFLWLSSGILAVLVLLVWACSWIGTLFGPFAYTLLVAGSPPDVPILRKLDVFPDEGIIVALVAVPVPTALILGGGYPVINALRASTDGVIATFLGAQLTMWLTFFMWGFALVAPLWMVWQARSMRPAAAFTAGLLGTATAMSAQNRLSGLSLPGRGEGSSGTTPPSGSGRTVDPLEGSPFQRSTDGGRGGALGGGDPGASTLGAGSGGSSGSGGRGGTPAGVGGGGAPTRATGATDGGGSGTSGSASASTNHTGSSGVSTTVAESVTEIPDSQEYEVGFETSDGEWQPHRDNTFSRGWLFEEGNYDRISSAFEGDDIHVRGVQNGETYDVQEMT